MAIIDGLKYCIRPVWRRLRQLHGSLTTPDRFLHHVDGVIHVGANCGRERDTYETFALEVLWVEPIPEVFGRLQQNVRGYERQRAVMALVTDVDGREYDFHLASNNGASSSILELADHRGLWPDVEYTSTMKITSTTLPSLLAREGLDPARYQALILDTQGSELLILRGAEPILRGFEYVKTEVADFESYAGCCRLDEMNAFMRDHGFRLIATSRFAGRADLGNYYDVVYRRRG